MKYNPNPKTVWELLVECKSRGLLLEVIIRNGFTGQIEATCDTYEAEDIYGEMIVLKHKRNKTRIEIWVA